MCCGCGGSGGGGSSSSSSSSSIDPYSPYPNCMNKITLRMVVAESTFLEKERIIVSQWWGGVLPSKRLLGMCRRMGSHFHNWTDYNGVTFLVVTRMGSHIFGIFGIRKFW